MADEFEPNSTPDTPDTPDTPETGSDENTLSLKIQNSFSLKVKDTDKVKKILYIIAAGLAACAVLVVIVICLVVPAVHMGGAKKLEAESPGLALQKYKLVIASPGAFLDKKAQAAIDALQASVGSTAAEDGTLTQTEISFGDNVWLVVEVRGNKKLLVSKGLLPLNQPYYQVMEDVSWEKSDIRKYLNEDYYNMFSEVDRALIKETSVKNTKNVENKTAAGKDTRDYIFLLSVEEAELYFPTAASRKAIGSSGRSAYYWLRTPGMNKFCAATVRADGEIGYAGTAVNSASRGVRPAMWVDIDAGTAVAETTKPAATTTTTTAAPAPESAATAPPTTAAPATQAPATVVTTTAPAA
ncbi:MAG: DUF6273 domain-containing protein [Oscillospiraceae bacterium]|jgi:hypothetical protein|nr:DUF6273 domain-containing protein [Oscillospiraceae bacterium]